MRRTFWAVLLTAELTSGSCAARYDVTEKNIAQLQSDLSAGRTTSAEIVSAYLARIEAVDRHGPTLRSVISLNPNATNDARAADQARKAGHARGALFGVPVLVKDNIETADPVPTTAGSLALAGNLTHRDAPAIAGLRRAGAIILGKTNLSEWANIRSAHSISGWSAIGGLVKNPYVLDRDACGSSSGSGAAVAASLAAGVVGTETDGSLVCPGSLNGIVSLKPTVGLVSRTHVIPISHSQDTPGPMGRSVADVAALLAAMAGSDAADGATHDANLHRTDYLAAIAHATLNGSRIGVAHSDSTPATDEDRLFDHAIAAMKKAGAILVPIKFTPPDPKSSGDAELLELETELKADLNAYLATTPPAVRTRTLAEVIAFDNAHPRETALFGQDIFLAAEKTKGLSDPAYLKARALLLRISRADGLDHILGSYKIDALVMPTDEPAWRVDVIKGDNDSSNTSFLPAVAGYPHLTVPMGYIRDLPVGISFIGRAWSEAKLLVLGAAFESLTHARHAPMYISSEEGTPAVNAAVAPLH